MKSFCIGTMVAFGAITASAPAQSAVGARPNIILIMSDDMGFSDISPYGAEIHTPALQHMADNGKLFTHFYNTARCCPSRASLLTGLYPHQAGVGHMLVETGHPGYGNHLTSDTVTIAEVLKEAGYSTYMAGKWHLAPLTYDPATDKEHWPRRRGFDKFFGTLAGSGNYYDPYNLCRDETLITPENDPLYSPENYYHTDALSDNALMFLEEHEKSSDEKPFFLYLAYTAPHWPLHAPEEAIAEYAGKYDDGYEPVRAARIERAKALGIIPGVSDAAPPVGDWDNVKNKEAEARLMETYAAMITEMDEGIGRIIEHLRASGELDNTLVMYLQDNGGSAEGRFNKPNEDMTPRSPMGRDELQKKSQDTHTRDGRPVRKGPDVMAGPADTYTAYKKNWATVSNAPFRMYKRDVHEGGISTPFIAYWPAGINATSATRIIREPAHLVDVMPTIVEAAGAKYPAERGGVKVQPAEGVSLLPALSGEAAIARQDPIFFEHEGNRAIRDGKWKLVAPGLKAEWELYDMSVDRAEMNDLAKEHPDVAKKLAAQWNEWAERTNVLPLGGWRDRPGRGNKKPESASTANHQAEKVHAGAAEND